MKLFDANTNALTAHRPRQGVPAQVTRRTRYREGSVLIIVLWIALGLVALALYFAQSMNFEMRASDNRVSAQAAEQAIEGGVRYINYLLTTQISNGSNGCVPDVNGYV